LAQAFWPKLVPCLALHLGPRHWPLEMKRRRLGRLLLLPAAAAALHVAPTDRGSTDDAAHRLAVQNYLASTCEAACRTCKCPPPSSVVALSWPQLMSLMGATQVSEDEKPAAQAAVAVPAVALPVASQQGDVQVPHSLAAARSHRDTSSEAAASPAVADRRQGGQAAREGYQEIAQVQWNPGSPLVMQDGATPVECEALNDGIGARENSWNPGSDVSWTNKFSCPASHPVLWNAAYVNGGPEKPGVIFWCCQNNAR